MNEEPSVFWQLLSEEHRADLDHHGFELVKRRQALRYFTWRWRWSTIARSAQVRFLLRHTSPRTWIAAWQDPELSDTAWDGVSWSTRERHLYTFAVRLLWDYATRNGQPDVIALDEPKLGGPLPVYADGRLISQDLANSALEVRRMWLDEPASFLEIGAGYGRTAFALMSMFPSATYTIIDIEPALSISRWYLGSLFEPRRLRFLLPAESSAIDDRSIDMAVAISSLHEMTPASVDAYLQLLDRVAKRAYLKQWTSWHNPDDDVRISFDQYPIPLRWETLHTGPAPVQSNFTEGLWSIP